MRVEQCVDGHRDPRERIAQVVRDDGEHLVAGAGRVARREHEPLPLHGVADGSAKPPSVHAALHQVVLGARTHGVERERIVGEAGQDDHRHVGRRAEHRGQRVEALSVRQREIEQHHVDPHLVERAPRVGEPLDVHDAQPRVAVGRHLVEQRGEQLGVRGRILDEQHVQRRAGRPVRRARARLRREHGEVVVARRRVGPHADHGARPVGGGPVGRGWAVGCSSSRSAESQSSSGEPGAFPRAT